MAHRPPLGEGPLSDYAASAMTSHVSHFGPFISYDVPFFIFHYQLSLFVTSVTSLALGILILTNNARNAVNRTFALFMVTVAGWSGLQALIGTWPDHSQWLRIAQVEHLFHVFIPSLFLHFSYTVAGWHKPLRLRMSYMISAISFCLVPFFFTGIDPQDYAKFALVVSPLYLPYMIWFSATILESLVVVRLAMNRASSIDERIKLKYIFWASTIGFAGGFPNFLYVYDIDLYPVIPFCTYLVVIYPTVIAYAIVRHQALDIRFVIRKSLVYSVLAAVITGGYFSVILVAEKALQGVMGYRSLIGSLIAGFAIALGFNPLKELIQRFVDQLFFHNSQAGLVEENERLRQEVGRTERLRSVATLAAGMAHEIKNPLAAIKTFAEYMPDKFADPAYREKYSKIMGQEVEKMNALVQRLLEFARPGAPRLQRVEPAALLRETLEFLQGTLVEKQVQVDLALTSHAAVQGDPGQLKQVFLNLLLNSIDAIEPPGRLMVSAHQENGHVRVTITDTGCGIAKADLPRIFDPFFTRKSGGTGLGLSVVHSIVQEHGGRINVDSVLGIGTTIHISLPTYGGSNGATAHPDR